MADQRRGGIAWTDETWNPLRGCSRVSEGCRNCYAERVAARFSDPGMPYAGLARRTESGPRWTGEVRLVPEMLDQPLRWRRPRRVFVNSMSDLFHEQVPDEWIDRIFGVMAFAGRHAFQVLTKRPERARAYLTTTGRGGAINCAFWKATEGFEFRGRWTFSDFDDQNDFMGGVAAEVEPHWPLPNVWLGVSVEDQATADERIPLLLETPAAVRWVSAEPLLGPVDLNVSRTLGAANDEITEKDDALGPPLGGVTGIDWVVVGGESGPGARPMHPRWARAIRDQCQAAGVPFFFKQWGAWRVAHPGEQSWADENPGRLAGCVNWRKLDDGTWITSFGGKKAAGRLLDGREWSEFPEVPREEIWMEGR